MRDESPYAAVAAIRDYLAFYPDRVDAIEEERVVGCYMSLETIAPLSDDPIVKLPSVATA
jgi:hypothetical protein